MSENGAKVLGDGIIDDDSHASFRVQEIGNSENGDEFRFNVCGSVVSEKLPVPPRRLTSLEVESMHVSGMSPQREKVLSTACILQLAYQSIGVVYGDIGTSPLYVFTSTFPDGLHPIHYSRDILGSLSLIIYTLTLIPLIKYVCIVLWANDNGDGGTFALYSVLCRGANVSLLPNQQIEDRELAFYKLEMPSRQLKRALKLKETLENSRCAKTSLLFIALLGTCMVIGDGVLTPAISGLTALCSAFCCFWNPSSDNQVASKCCCDLVNSYLGSPFFSSKVWNIQSGLRICPSCPHLVLMHWKYWLI